MIYLSAEATTGWTWPEVILILGLLFLAVAVGGGIYSGWLELRKARARAKQEVELRRLVHRYEQLAENTLDAQRRAAADIADLRTRTAAVEQLLRTVE